MDQKVWVFDLDGTLVQTAANYGNASLKFVRLMFDTFGWRSPQWLYIGQMLYEIDMERAKDWGGYRGRFPGSLAICYWRLCEELGVPYSEEIARFAWRIGESAVAAESHHPGQLIPGVEEVLTTLIAKGDIIYVVTMGDPIVQCSKWDRCGLSRWVPEERFIVVRWGPRPGYDGDKTKALASIRKRHSGQKVLMVGDSISSDINPALAAGLIAIFIPSYWKWGKGQDSPVPEDAKKFKELSDILSRYSSL